jgi:DNA-binding CsgD family transcriptional regulator
MMEKTIKYQAFKKSESTAEDQESVCVPQLNAGDTLLSEFKKKLINGADNAPSFIYFPENENDRDSEISHKLNRIVQELKYIEENYQKFLSLTSREKEIIKLIVTSFNNQQISEKLFISVRTVEQHRKNMNRKLETTSVPEICAFAYAFNLV